MWNSSKIEGRKVLGVATALKFCYGILFNTGKHYTCITSDP